jgi:hypothetical protein
MRRFVVKVWITDTWIVRILGYKSLRRESSIGIIWAVRVFSELNFWITYILIWMSSILGKVHVSTIFILVLFFNLLMVFIYTWRHFKSFRIRLRVD